MTVISMSASAKAVAIKQEKRRSSIQRHPPATPSQTPIAIVGSHHTPFATLDVRGQIFYMVPHGAKFVVKVQNPFPHDKCSFHLEIDGIGMGSWVLKPGAVGHFERPVKISQCFTFMSTPLVSRAEEAADMIMNDSSAIYDPQVQQALFHAPLGTGIIEDNVNNGQVKCTFTPEVRNDTWRQHRQRNIPVDNSLFGRRRKSMATGETCQQLQKEFNKSNGGRKCDFSQQHIRCHPTARPSSVLKGSNGSDTRSGSVSTTGSVSSTAPSSSAMSASSSKKKKLSLSTRQRSSYMPPSFPPQTPTLTPGASTLQGHSLQVFGRTSLQKDHSRAVTCIINLVASVPPIMQQGGAAAPCMLPPAPFPFSGMTHQQQHCPPPVPITMATTLPPGGSVQCV